MFGIGPLELVVIVVAALIFVGPQRMPHVMKQFGKIFVQAKRYSNDVRDTFQDVVRQAEEELGREELEALKKEIAAKLPSKSEIFADLPTRIDNPLATIGQTKTQADMPDFDHSDGDHGSDFFSGEPEPAPVVDPKPSSDPKPS